MKPQPKFTTKRQPVRKGLMKRIFANVPGRKQRVAATATAMDFEPEMPGRKVGNALAVIVAVHVAAAGLVFFHHWRLEGKAGDTISTPGSGSSMPSQNAGAAPMVPLAATPNNPPKVSPAEQSHMVRAGETYDSIAESKNVDLAELRVLNNHQPIQSGMVLRIPPKRIVATEPADVAELRRNAPPVDRGNVEIPRAVPIPEAPVLVKPEARHQVVSQPSTNKPQTASNTPKSAERSAANTESKPRTTTPVAATSKRSYQVKEGDSLIRIAGRYNMTPEKLMKANGISDPRKLRAGAVLVIPN